MEQLRVLARYDAKITEQQNTLARFPNNYFTRPSVKDLRDNFLAKWPKLSKVCLHLKRDLQQWQS